MDDEIQQKSEWRARLIGDVIGRKFADETLAAMLEAGLDQAHSEGLQDAAYVCRQVGELADDPSHKRAAAALARAIDRLEAMNRTAAREDGELHANQERIPEQ